MWSSPQFNPERLAHSSAAGSPEPVNKVYFDRIVVSSLSYGKIKIACTLLAESTALEYYEKFLASADGKLPDEEFKARQRVRIIRKELEKR